MPPSQFMRRKDAAQYLRNKFGVGSPATLAKFATLGGGPTYRKNGKHPIYLAEDLDAWALSKIGPAQTSTSQRPTKSAAAPSIAEHDVVA